VTRQYTVSSDENLSLQNQHTMPKALNFDQFQELLCAEFYNELSILQSTTQIPFLLVGGCSKLHNKAIPQNLHYIENSWSEIVEPINFHDCFEYWVEPSLLMFNHLQYKYNWPGGLAEFAPIEQRILVKNYLWQTNDNFGWCHPANGGYRIMFDKLVEKILNEEIGKKINSVKDEVQATVEKGTKPLVLTEGETDPIYIKTALELLGEKEILAQVDIEWVGISIGKGKSINTGEGGLKNTRDVLVSNPKFLTRKVLLIYDCDTDKSNEDHELLKIRKIPQQKNRKVTKGIENLFPDHLFTEEFYLPKTKYGDYGEENQIQEFQKRKFCKWICEQRKQANDFVDFKIIIDFIKDCLGTVIY
jgi:hypothetical protein